MNPQMSKRSRAGVCPSIRLPGAMVLLHLLLAGCAADHGEKPPTTAAEETAVDMAKVEPARPTIPATPQPPPNLIGKRQTEIIEILGRPVFSRRDRPALLLRYRDEGCILDLFLYPERNSTEGGTLSRQAVEHIEARSLTGERIEAQSCIAAVIKARSAALPG